jgi:hypothetical protein
MTADARDRVARNPVTIAPVFDTPLLATPNPRARRSPPTSRSRAGSPADRVRALARSIIENGMLNGEVSPRRRDPDAAQGLMRARGLAHRALGLGTSACSGLLELGAVKKAVVANYEHHYGDAVAAADFILARRPPEAMQELYLQKAEASRVAQGRSDRHLSLPDPDYRDSPAADQARGRLDTLGVSCGLALLALSLVLLTACVCSCL